MDALRYMIDLQYHQSASLRQKLLPTSITRSLAEYPTRQKVTHRHAKYQQHQDIDITNYTSQLITHPRNYVD